MDVIDDLAKKLEIMSIEFQFLIQENQKLKAQIENLKTKNDVITRNNQDMLLRIKDKLKKESES
jgi:cell division protein FtsB